MNSQIDDIADSIKRHKREATRLERTLEGLVQRKRETDNVLARELTRYDSAFVSNVRLWENRVATLRERRDSLQRLARMPSALLKLETEAGATQGKIDQLRSALADERSRLASADKHINAIAEAFRQILLEVGFPGVYDADKVVLDPRNWLPSVIHDNDAWTFFDAGSGGKKTLFNVCYALAVHRVAISAGLSLPTFLIVDSPIKNITQDENPVLVEALYAAIYRLAKESDDGKQFILIDSHLVFPSDEDLDFKQHRFGTGENGDADPLIPYYRGP